MVDVGIRRAIVMIALAGAGLPQGGCYEGLEPGADPAASGDAGPGEGGEDDGPEPGPEAEAREPVTMRRLTRFEYDNTVRALLGDDSRPAQVFPPEEHVDAFDNNATALTFPPVMAEQAMSTGRRLADLIAADPTTWVPCEGQDLECGRQFIEQLGARAWRRPLQAPEVERLLDVFAHGQQDEGFARGVQMAAHAIFISAPFFYRVERGDGQPVEGKPGLMRPTSWEMASRLSYLLWSEPPDRPLREAAQADALREPAQIEAQVDRMMADPRARLAVARFHALWLGLGSVDSIAKDPERFPGWSPELPASFRAEIDAFVDDVFWTPGGSIEHLLTAAHSFVDAPLAAFYGLEAPAGEGLARVQLDPSRRAGLLSRPALLALHAGFDQTSPTHRGLLVRQQLLCDVMPPPPPEVDDTPSEPTDDETTRGRVEEHTSNETCAPCHSLIDPIGFALEHYDATGAFREDENGLPIDARGEAIDSDVGEFDGLEQLGAALAASADVRRCVATQWYRYAYGRREDETLEGPAVVDELDAALADTGGDLQALLRALTRTDAFLYLPLPEAE